MASHTAEEEDALGSPITSPLSQPATKAEMLASLEESSALETPLPPPTTETIKSQEALLLNKDEDCTDPVDWETIAEYLSRCETFRSTASSEESIESFPESSPPKPKYTRPAYINMNPYLPNRTLLSKRSSPDSPTSPHLRRSPASSAPSPTLTPAAVSTTSSGLSTGAKAGIASAATVGIVILFAGFVIFHSHRRKRRYGYSRTKGKDGTPSELEGHFVVTGGRDRGEASPMIHFGHNRRESDHEAIGLGIGLQDRGHPSPGLSVGGGQSPLLNSDYNISAISQQHYEVSPQLSHQHSQSYLLQSRHPDSYTPPEQSYHTPRINSGSRSPPSPEDLDPFEQHNQRSRPSHPLSGLSEAIPPPPLQARLHHFMADYQNAVPLGYSNGFVQVGSPRESLDGNEPVIEVHSPEDTVQNNVINVVTTPQPEERREVAAERSLERVDGDPNLPRYEEMDIARMRPPVPKDWEEQTSHVEFEIDSEDEGERRRSLTKEELG